MNTFVLFLKYGCSETPTFFLTSYYSCNVSTCRPVLVLPSIGYVANPHGEPIPTYCLNEILSMMTYLREIVFLLVSLRTEKRQNHTGHGNALHFPPGVESYFLSGSKHPGGEIVSWRGILLIFGTTTPQGNPRAKPQ